MTEDKPARSFRQLMVDYGITPPTPEPVVNGTAAPAYTAAPAPGNTHSYAAAALRGEAADVAAHPKGGRNVRLNTAWYRMGRHIGAGSIDIETVRVELTNAARSSGLLDDEIATVLRDGPTSAATAGATNPRYPAPATEVPDATVLPDAEVPGDVNPGSDPGPPLNPRIDWHHLFDTDDDDEVWIVSPLLPARRMVALYSAPKAGKSLLMLEVAVGISRGTPVLGGTPDRPHRVLYVDFENDPQGDIRTRLEAMDVGPDQLDNLCYLTFPSLAKFDTAQGALDLLRHVEAYKCEVVVIDTVSRSVQGEENDNDTWLAFYRHTGLALKRAGVACIRLDHSGKDREKGMRGGSAKSGDVDAVWRLTPLNDTTVLLECTDQRMPVPVKSLTLVRQEWPLEHRLDDSAYAAVDARVAEVNEQLTNLQVPTDASVRKATRALRVAGYKVRNDAIEAAVRARKNHLI